ncbi:hypothetical protein [Rhodocista pekingensis]|uniref:Uncharacterized protein n=1 Tax=Rhodocista pekingensis TaxID=201185 RepID=A0ABW2KY38_9PROT
MSEKGLSEGTETARDSEEAKRREVEAAQANRREAERRPGRTGPGEGGTPPGGAVTGPVPGESVHGTAGPD